ncbi:unnamed protein product [Adineta ricciae]|uniref:Uncharacterized protein n=1 Tax=Adineta ricciae TaxID=249248 RepID=A0A813WK36_ADIRI|nr:unnamed protein product [Adineta ricciae]
MRLTMTTLVFFVALFLAAATIDPPPNCRFLNPVHDSSAETALMDFFYMNTSFIFRESNFFQPQCLLCENEGGLVCFGYKGGSSYGIATGSIKSVRLITNLPYLYSLGENVGASVTTIDTIAVLREDLVISYETLARFKGISTLDPVVVEKTIALRLGMICLPNDKNEHSLTITGSVDKLSIRLFINEIWINGSNGIILNGNKRTRINCKNQSVVVESNGAVPDESPCSSAPCLGPEYCLTYQPEYSTTRETWCPLTEKNWISNSDNNLKLLPSDLSLPLYIQLERVLLYEKEFTVVLNQNWFIDYAGILTISIPEATSGLYPDPVWKITLPSTDRQPLNQRNILLHNCTNVRIRYNASSSSHFQTTVVFVDMRSNSTFTIKANLDQAKQLCNPDILIATDENSSTTTTTTITKTATATATTNTESAPTGTTTPWDSTGFAYVNKPSHLLLIPIYFGLMFCKRCESTNTSIKVFQNYCEFQSNILLSIMATNILHAIVCLLVVNATFGLVADSSISRSFFLPRALDPFCDEYVETVTRMSLNELMSMPQLNDTEFLDQLARGIDSVLVSEARTGLNGLFDSSVDGPMQYQAETEGEWQELMADAPASINYMGAVMAIASRQDFPLKENFDYKYVKYPKSFQTTLVQVSNEMYTALFNAHTGMDKIQLNMRQIPAQLKTALKLITQASTSMVKAMLPRTLANIGRYANDSATIARSASNKFEKLQELLQEIVLASTQTNSANKDKAAELAKEAEKAKNKQKEMDAEMAKLQNEYAVARQDLETARRNYHTAMMNVPGGQWDAAAWEVYAAQRPSVTCSGSWFWKKCRSHREEHFSQYNHEAKQKAEEALKLLKEAEERSKNAFNQQMNKQNALGTAMTALAMIKFDEISINQTITVLLDATKKISDVKEQWSRITRFFTNLASRTEHTQNVILEDFLGVIADVQSIGQSLDPIDKAVFVTMLAETAKDIDEDTHMLFLMANIYSDVSSKHLVDRIASLSGLLTIQNNAERDAYVKSVANTTQHTSLEIKRLAADRQKTYESASSLRQEQYMNLIQEVILQEELDLLGGIGIGRRR